MKKILTGISMLCIFSVANAQPCIEFQGMTPVVVRFATNAYGYPESNLPTVPLYWNRFYKLDESTGKLNSLTCSYTGDPNLHEFAFCACILSGTYFRRVTGSCDPTSCGGDVSTIPPLPKTDNDGSASNWSQPSLWMTGQVPDIASSPSILVTKSIQIDTNLHFPADHWLIISAGNSSINSGRTVTINSVMMLYPGSSLENSGNINGSGKIVGTLLNKGTLSPGNSPGNFTIMGNYTAGSAAVHQVEIAAANSYDTINIMKDASGTGGSALLGGVLNVNLLNGFLPSLGDSFKIITFASSSGNFSGIDMPALPPGLSWAISYNTTNITLKVTATVLPLTITYTRANLKNSGVQVDWITSGEINVKEYEIERKTRDAYFGKAGSVRANGSINNSYSWLDEHPIVGDNYYRIKAIDIDGRWLYSATMLIKFKGTEKFTAYPNPVKRGELLLLNSQNNKPAKIEIINSSGQLISGGAIVMRGITQVPIPVSLATGQYVLRAIFENNIILQKLIIQ